MISRPRSDRLPSVDDELARITTWVERSGRALELRVARIFQRAGADVRMSHPYMGQQQARETDVLADFPWLALGNADARVTVIVECKHSADKPWVAFYDDTSNWPMDSLDDWAAFAHGTFPALTEDLVPLWRGHVPFTAPRTAALVVSALGAERNDKNFANNAVRQALSASAAQRLEYLRLDEPSRRGLVVLSVVATTAHLYDSWLDGDGQLVITPVDGFDVWGHDAHGQRRRVFVRNEAALRDLAEGLRNRVIDAERLARSQE